MISRLSNLVVALYLALSGVAAAQTSPSEQRGQTFVRANCSNCHATDRVSASPSKLHRRFVSCTCGFQLKASRKHLSRAFARDTRICRSFSSTPAKRRMLSRISKR